MQNPLVSIFIGDNIAVYPKDLVILNVCEGSRAGTSHETFVRSFTSFWMTLTRKYIDWVNIYIIAYSFPDYPFCFSPNSSAQV